MKATSLLLNFFLTHTLLFNNSFTVFVTHELPTKNHVLKAVLLLLNFFLPRARARCGKETLTRVESFYEKKIRLERDSGFHAQAESFYEKKIRLQRDSGFQANACCTIKY